MTAVINSQPGRARMGFWNAQIYQLAQKSDSPFHPLNATTDNSNLYYTGQPGTVYNQASGLGTTDFAKLAEDYKYMMESSLLYTVEGDSIILLNCMSRCVRAIAF